MTVVAYKAGILACDSCWATDEVIDSLNVKIVPMRYGGLVGQAGDNDARVVVNKIVAARTPDDLPTLEFLRKHRVDFIGLVVFPDLRVFKVGSTNKLAEDVEVKDIGVWECKLPHASIGTGREVALGAMEAGASAAEAAEIATRFITSCRPPIHAFNVSDYPLKKVRARR